LTAQAYTNHYAEIVAYFVTNPGTTHTFGPWSCTLGALDFPDPGFGVVAGINADMFYAFGGVRDFTVTSYQLTMQDVGFNNIWPVVNITAQGSFTDLYDFDIYNGTLSRMGATVQAGFPTLGGAGRVFQETIKFNGTWP
jgi:hypothetical protein